MREDTHSHPAGRNAVVAAILYGALTLGVVAFQLALAAGARWGHLAMSGAISGRLPAGMRAAAAVQALVLLLFGLVIATRAGLLLPRWFAASRKLAWVVVSGMVASAALNMVTPSGAERALWLPVTLALLTCALVVARAR